VHVLDRACDLLELAALLAFDDRPSASGTLPNLLVDRHEEFLQVSCERQGVKREM
jgi:hypothetical protein